MAERKPLSSQSRKLAGETAMMRGVFNKYLKPSAGALKAQARISEIAALLATGTTQRIVPKFGKVPDGAKVREGSVPKERPLLPSQRAKLVTERLELQNGKAAKPELRAEFLAILPQFAARMGFTAEALQESGVSAADLKAAGLLK